MKLVRIRLIPKRLRLKRPFVSSHETLTEREITIVEVKDQSGLVGYGELDAFSQPFYTSETQATARWVIEHTLVNLVKNIEFATPIELFDQMVAVKGNQLAKAAIDMAVWDLFAKIQRLSLADVLAKNVELERAKNVRVGISIGIQNEDRTMDQVERAIKKGYGRIKLKVRGNTDLTRIAHVAAHFPTAPLCVDANGSLTYESDLASKIDRLRLIMIEDPFKVDQSQLSARLQEEMTTALCYDEAITSVHEAVRAINAGECRIVSIKAGILGGLTPALAMIRAHQKFHFPIWCGGLLEGGVGRAANLALASLNTFAYPGDISETSRYYEHDIAKPNFQLENGCLVVPSKPGIGVDLV
ncbi:o-succinylbenzoate synthase [Lentilactobacillus raoultii]|uniref:o-succinylbenzoate synthase n=1 Tax=Lentilactobacillus raoultii TaxID=1987503 RepID=A0ABW3PRH7_9LACO|nr:o-succinylbenzoate synthase [Lentilactobacillus raoultii]